MTPEERLEQKLNVKLLSFRNEFATIINGLVSDVKELKAEVNQLKTTQARLSSKMHRHENAGDAA